MVLRTLIDTIISGMSGGVQSDDRVLHPKYIYNAMLPIRSTLMTNKMNKKQKMSDWSYQVIPCIELKSVDSSLCPCIPPTGCKVKRSKNKIPSPLSGLTYLAIDGLYSSDMSKRFKYTTKVGYDRKKGNRYGKTTDNYFMIIDEYLYVYGKDVPAYVLLKGIFIDPVKGKINFPDCNTIEDNPDEVKNCTSILDTEIKIDPDLEAPLLEMLSEKLKREFLYNRTDIITSNSSEDARQ